MSRDWIEVDPTDVTEPKIEKLDGVELRLYVSPYDVPEALRGYFDSDRDRFIIEFKYLNDDSVRRVPHSQYVTLWIGKKSERLYGLEVDVNALGAQWVSLIVKAIDEQKKNRKRGRTFNYEIARRLVKEHAPELLAGAA